MDGGPTLSGILRQIPVLPLHGAVLFPGVVLPMTVIHAEECALMADAIAGSRHLVLSLRLGRDKVHAARAEVSAIGCVARITFARRLPDGAYEVLLQGLARVELLEEIPQPRPYRSFRAQVVPQPATSSLIARAADVATLRRLVAALSSSVAQSDPHLVEVLRASEAPLALMDIVGAVLIPQAEAQQDLLACRDAGARLERVNAALATALRLRGGDAGAELSH